MADGLVNIVKMVPIEGKTGRTAGHGKDILQYRKGQQHLPIIGSHGQAIVFKVDRKANIFRFAGRIFPGYGLRIEFLRHQNAVRQGPLPIGAKERIPAVTADGSLRRIKLHAGTIAHNLEHLPAVLHLKLCFATV